MTIPTTLEFVANTTPAITAAWLNGINDWVYPAYTNGTLVTASATLTLPTTTGTLARLGANYETYAWASIAPASPATNSAFSPANRTITFAEAGTYLVHLQARSANSDVYTAHTINFALSGTATRNDVFGNALIASGIVAQGTNIYETITLEITATVGQTLIVQPTANSTYAAGTHTFYAGYTVQMIA